MRMGKKPHLDPPIEWKISVPTSVVAAMELLFRDPLTNKPRHGARSKLITQLLREHLKKIAKENKP